MRLRNTILMNFDKIWCGINQVSACSLISISEEKNTTNTLSLYRFFSALFLLIELIGYFFITVSFAEHRPVFIFLIGVFLKTLGALISAFFQNKSGIFLSLELQKYLNKLNSNSIEIHTFLVDKGCSEAEITSLHLLPTNLYQTELSGYQRLRILNIGSPISCGIALLINGDIITALVVIILGLSSFPLGEKFFKENTFRNESKLRLGLASHLIQYVDKIYNEHILLTVKVNFLSQLPLLLFALRFILNGSGHILSSFFALTQGLIGLTGTLAFQKVRVTSMRTTQTALHLIQVLSGPGLIVTPRRWEEHCRTPKKEILSLPDKLEEGVVLKNFSPNIPHQDEKEMFSISCIIPFGTVCLVNAPSGRGKSTFLSALRHLIEHTGDIFFCIKNKVFNVHEFNREEFDSKLFFFKEESIDKSTRLIDLFKNVTFIAIQGFLQEAKSKFDPLLVELAWKSPDNLIEQEIKYIESNKQSVFPENMIVFLKDLRIKQIEKIKFSLEKSGGNLIKDRIFPERNFLTLSSGEKRRLIPLIALESCRVIEDIHFVILDEPLTHLDKSNINHQIQIIRDMQELNSPPSILIISHHFIEEMKEKLLKIQEINI